MCFSSLEPQLLVPLREPPALLKDHGLGRLAPFLSPEVLRTMLPDTSFRHAGDVEETAAEFRRIGRVKAFTRYFHLTSVEQRGLFTILRDKMPKVLFAAFVSNEE